MPAKSKNENRARPGTPGLLAMFVAAAIMTPPSAGLGYANNVARSGKNGADGNPSQNGGSATATANTVTDATNSATADGGH